MGAGSFLSGALSGYTARAGAMKKSGQPGVLRKKKKVAPSQVPKVDLPPGSSMGVPFSFKRGGKVKKGGMAKVHKNEQILTAKQARRYRRSKKR